MPGPVSYVPQYGCCPRVLEAIRPSFVPFHCLVTCGGLPRCFCCVMSGVVMHVAPCASTFGRGCYVVLCVVVPSASVATFSASAYACSFVAPVASVAALAVCAKRVAIAASKAVYSAPVCCEAALLPPLLPLLAAFCILSGPVFPIGVVAPPPLTVADVVLLGGLSTFGLVCPYLVPCGPIGVGSLG